ncbi:MAG: T9SS type A sorting domain-containing protein [Microscillaceae bacterium]|nr:T9SS type A sorting domain-containing protein [Microscillaceae bacterium]
MRTMRQLRQSFEDRIQALLTSEQQSRFQEIKQGRKTEMRAHLPALRAFRQAGRENLALKADLKAYRQEHIRPVMQAHRNHFESQLTEADQSTLADIRAQMQSLQPQMKVMRDIQFQMRQSQSLPTEAQKAEWLALHEAKLAQMHRLRKLAESYRPALEAIWEEMASQRENWNNELQALIQQHLGQDIPAPLLAKMGQRGMPGPAKFLLMAPQPETESLAPSPAPLVYPNPAGQQHTLRYEVPQAGNVRIQLLDARGKVLRTLVNEKRAVGSYSQQVDTHDLAPGRYFYQIQTPAGNETQRLILE